jgi:hypothetical protein
MPGRSSCNTAAPSGTSQTDSMHHVISSPAFGTDSTSTLFSDLENLSTPIPNPEAQAIITYQVGTRAAAKNQRWRQKQLHQQPVSTPRLMVSGSHSIQPGGHSDMTRLIFETDRLQELYMWMNQLFMSASDLDTVSYATQKHLLKPQCGR